MSARSRVSAAALAAATVIATSATAISVLVPSPAHAGVTGSVQSGTATWGLSTYLNSATFGRPNPLPEGYLAPATFTETGRLTGFGAGDGVVAPDGSADLAFSGTSVNFAKTSGAWLKLADLQADLDAAGNGTVSAVISYGQSVTGTAPAMTYDPAQAPQRGPQRVDLVTLSGNTAADVTRTSDTAAWAGLDGAWAPAFQAFLAGDPSGTPAVPGFIYAGQVNANADRTPLPFGFEVSTETPAMTAAVTGASFSQGLTVDADGTGFRAVTDAGDGGVYVGIAESGGLPDVSNPGNIALFAVAALARPAEIVDGVLDKTVVAPTEKLDPAKEYSVYTWQAHTHGNASQDTETPLEIDWTALEQKASTTTLTGATRRAYGSTATITATVPGPGSVTLTGVGADQTVDVVEGRAVFAVPASLAVGVHRGTLAYSGGGDFLPSQAGVTFLSTKAASRTLLTVATKPTAGTKGRPGAARVAVSGPAGVAVPAGPVTVKLTKPGGQTRTVTGLLKNGVATVALPKLGRGQWTAVATYAGNGSYVASKQTRRFGVKVA